MDLERLEERYAEFVTERDWDQFHTPQNLAQAVSIESSELLESFLWMNNPSSAQVREDAELLASVREEMADVLIYLIGLANCLDIDLLEAVDEKMGENEERFGEEEVEEMNEYLQKWQ